jgi:hypothetical protein
MHAHMPVRLEDLERIEREFGARFANAWDNFANFALRDNVLEVAVGLMYIAHSCRNTLRYAKVFLVWPLPSPPLQTVSSPT